MTNDWPEIAQTWIDSLRFALQGRLLEVTYAMHDVVIHHGPPGSVTIEVGKAAFKHAILLVEFASRMLPAGTHIEVGEQT